MNDKCKPWSAGGAVLFKCLYSLNGPALTLTRTLSSLQGSETVIFPCERWLAKSEDDGETVRELMPSDIIIEKLSRDGNLKVTEVEVEDALESMWTSLAPLLPHQIGFFYLLDCTKQCV